MVTEPKFVAAEGLPNAVRLTWRHPLAEHVQGLFLNAAGGTFTLTFTTPEGTTQDGDPFSTAGGTSDETDPILYATGLGAAWEDVETALLALSNIDSGDIVVKGGPSPEPISVRFTGQYSGVTVPALVLDDAGLTAPVIQAEIQGGDIVGQKDPGIRSFHVQVWETAFDTGTLEENREVNTAEEFIYPCAAERFLRVRSVANGTETSAWVEVSATPQETAGSDGFPPGSSPAPTVTGGPTYIVASWTPVANSDTVTYEVHLSTSSGFTPSGGTLVGEIDGTLFFIRRDAAGVALVYGTTYYVKVVAKDADGSASASAQGSAQMVKVATTDIAANAITADQILAGAVTAEKLEAIMVLASRVIAGNPIGLRSEMNHPDYPFLYWDGVSPRFSVDDLGAVYAPTLQFGTSGSLESNNTVQLPVATPFTIPARVQEDEGQANSTTLTVNWGVSTGAHHLLVVVISIEGNATPTSPPSGYTLGADTTSGTNRCFIYYKADSAAGAANPSVTFASSRRITMTIAEYSGIALTTPRVAWGFSHGEYPNGKAGILSLDPVDPVPAYGLIVAGIGTSTTQSDPTSGTVEVGSPQQDSWNLMSVDKVVLVPSLGGEVRTTLGVPMTNSAGCIAYFAAQPTPLGTPDTDTAALHAELVSGIPQLAYKSDDGTVRHLDAGIHYANFDTYETIDNTTTETDIFAYTFPAYMLRDKDFIIAEAFGSTSNQATSGTLTWRLYINDVEVEEVVISSVATERLTKVFSIEWKLGVSDAIPNFQWVSSLYTEMPPATSASAVAERLTQARGYTEFDFSTTNELRMTIQWATGSVTNAVLPEGNVVRLERGI